MAKKNRAKKNDIVVPEGMSRRQAKLAARAAERAALEREPRPFGGLQCEADLVALQNFVPAATAPISVNGAERKVILATVLPGGAAAMVREESDGGEAFVALQTAIAPQNPGRELAAALQWVLEAKPGQVLEKAQPDAETPALKDILVADQELTVEAHDSLSWWFPEGQVLDPQIKDALERANNSLLPSLEVQADVPGAVWWVHPGDKAHIRWVRSEEEEKLLRALARIASRGELKLGEETKFAGAFRVDGVTVPVWDLDPQRPAEDYKDDLEALDKKIAEELENDAQLNSEERRHLQNIKSRQVTL